MDGTRKKIHPELDNPDPESPVQYVNINQRITRLQPTVPEKLGNKEDPKRDTWITLGRGNR